MVSGTNDKEHLMSYFASDSTEGYMYGEEFQVELGWPFASFQEGGYRK